MKKILTLITFILLSSCQFLFAGELNIIPKPVSQVLMPFNCTVKNIFEINIQSNNKELKRLARYLKDEIAKKTGLKPVVKQGKTNGGIILSINPETVKETDGYKLKIDENKVVLTGNNYTGLFYGIQTLKMILAKEKEFYFPCCEVSDYPRYPHRGFMLDASRHFQTIDFVKRVLDAMAALKLNVFHWHLIDDEGWRIESKKHPKLNEIGSYMDSLNAVERNGYYTQSEIKEVLKYAGELYIKVIPEVEMPGHSRAVMASYPELLCPTGEGGKTFCAGNEKSYEFLKDIAAEIIDIFNPEIMHVGGDERPKGVWEKCPKCKQMIVDKNLANEDMLQNYFMKEICNFISKKGVKTLAWAENIKDAIPENQIVEGWHPGESWDAARRGYYTVNADNWFTYFDYPSYPRTDKPDWMPVLNLEKAYSFNPTPDSLKENEKKFVIGSECALWTELVPMSEVQYHIFPRILAFTECVWSSPEKNYENFLARVKKVKPYINSMGFEFEKGAW
jgi:hexosaminidase